MFSFKTETPERVIATATIPIVADITSSPVIWTPELETIETNRVIIYFTLTKSRNRPSLKIYPLTAGDKYGPPAFVVVKNDNKLIKEKSTYMCFQHENFSIIRPLSEVMLKTKWSIYQADIQWAALNLLTLMKHCYFSDLISERLVDEADRDFERLAKIIARHDGTDFAGERRNARNLGITICKKILNNIEQEVNNAR